MNSQKITNLATPTLDTDAATKAYVDASSGAGSGITLDTAKQNFISLDGTQTNLITAPIPMNNKKITGLATPTVSTDATTKAYVDSRTPFKNARITMTTAPTNTGSYVNLVGSFISTGNFITAV